MKLCLDVHYSDAQAAAAAVLFADWKDATPIAKFASLVPTAADYEAGKFYLRELAPLLAVIEQVKQPVDTLVIDGYCYLDAAGAPGLGQYLAEALDQPTIIIGVAKNRFRDSQHAVEVTRGGSVRSLFVTSIGTDVNSAASCIGQMAGEHRIPILLKAVDRLARASL